ncbi:uncharacterized protein B0H18DRAFT_968871 [Fomitopsis serialis]|uniref:uncharacterized protein n=1 Tax=Fomitopsis serialis TaxID=139415 RepID=UPI00200879D6|nr:uncharacterized protein B0H18DRAFT_968871 [Neoantrodia serialis]KAH9937041.1 hypothetical protein B0H18DRAFT_968871 [Neoantrodia serialis]
MSSAPTPGSIVDLLGGEAALASLLRQRTESHPQPQHQPNQALLANLGYLLSNNAQLSFNPSVSQGTRGAPQPFNATGHGQSRMTGPEMGQLLVALQQATQQTAVSGMSHPNSQPPSQATTLDKLAGSSPDDERILVNTLATRGLKGWSVRQALEALHGVNNHTGGSWKDYFLDNYDRLSQRVSLSNEEEEDPESSPVAISRGRTMSRGDSSGNGPPTLHTSRHSASRPRPKKQRSRSRGRSNSRVRPQQRVRFSESPSRSPTPPPPAGPSTGNGRRYTEEEEEYFIKSLKRQLRNNPFVTFKKMAQVLAEKAPACGRSVDSWRSHLTMGRRTDVDRMIADARDKHKGRMCEELSVEHHGDDQSSAEDESNEEKSAGTHHGKGRESSQACLPDEDPDTEEDIPNMTTSGQLLRMADFRMAARYIASRGDWDSALLNSRGGTLSHCRYYPQRTAKAWAQAYLNHRTVIDQMVPKYRARYAQCQERRTSSKAGDAGTTTGSPSFHDGSKRSHREVDGDDGAVSATGKRPRDSY